MNAEKKASKYFNENKVFKLLNSLFAEEYLIEGKTGNWIVRYNKLTGRYSCNCKNIRDLPCSHILAVKLLKEK